METKDKDAEDIQKVLILGFIHYYPFARYSELKDQDDLEYACRIANDVTLSPEERGKAIEGVGTILRRLTRE